jgi:hypothetical protein
MAQQRPLIVDGGQVRQFTAGDQFVIAPFIFPAADGSLNQVLVTDGSGNLSWSTRVGPTGPTGPTGSTGPTGPTGPSYVATSVTSLAIGTGSKTFTTQAGLAYLTGNRVRAASAADGTNFMEGLVTSYSGTTLVVSIDLIGGSGTKTDWNIGLAGQQGIQGLTGLEGDQGPTGATGPKGDTGPTGPLAIGSAVTSGTTGSVLYVGTGPVLAQDNSYFYYDSVAHKLTIGANTSGTYAKLQAIGGALVISTAVATADACIHINDISAIANPATKGRVIQASPSVAAQAAWNLYGATSAGGAMQWWTFGINTDDSFHIAAGADQITNNMFVITGAGKVGIGMAPTTNFAVTGLTGVAGTAVVIDANGNFYKTSSARKYKKDIQPLAEEFVKILGASPVSFRYIETDCPSVGYIAEDFVDLGLKNLVVCDDAGQPESIRY